MLNFLMECNATGHCPHCLSFSCIQQAVINHLRKYSHASIYGSSIAGPVAQQVISSMRIIMGKDGTNEGEYVTGGREGGRGREGKREGGREGREERGRGGRENEGKREGRGGRENKGRGEEGGKP